MADKLANDSKVLKTSFKSVFRYVFPNAKMEYSQKAKEVNENRVLMRSGLKQE